MKNIIIPDACIPESVVLVGFSGGMGLFIVDFHSFTYLFQYTNVARLAYATVSANHILN